MPRLNLRRIPRFSFNLPWYIWVLDAVIWIAIIVSLLAIFGAFGKAYAGPGPFGTGWTPALTGDVLLKARHTADLIKVDEALCERQCPDVLREIVERARAKEGKARIGEINRSVNLLFKPIPDRIDLWSSPLETVNRGGGDCEDYAILKYLLLKLIGFKDEDLRLVIAQSMRRNEQHAILAVRSEGEWLILDNQRMIMITDFQLLFEYVPLYVISQGEVLKRGQ